MIRLANSALEAIGSMVGGLLARAVANGSLYFPFVSEAISAIPFSLGWKFRRAVYARLLPAVGKDVVLHHGEIGRAHV